MKLILAKNFKIPISLQPDGVRSLFGISFFEDGSNFGIA